MTTSPAKPLQAILELETEIGWALTHATALQALANDVTDRSSHEGDRPEMDAWVVFLLSSQIVKLLEELSARHCALVSMLRGESKEAA